MADQTKISWADATWNAAIGCSRVSPGCKNCYAETLSTRYGWTTKPWTARNAEENVILKPHKLREPLRWREPRRIFVNSLSDFFHEQIPDSFRDQMMDVMEACPHHIFQILTKRPERMREYMLGWPYRAHGAIPLNHNVPQNIWLGVSVEDQRRAHERIPILLQTPAAVRFLSAEPLLGPLNLEPFLWVHDGDGRRMGGPLGGLHWIIVGGESGAGFRPMKLDWAEQIRLDCERAGVAFFFKQIAAFRPGQGEDALGRVYHEFPAPPVAASPEQRGMLV